MSSRAHPTQILFLGGASGTGKTAVAFEVSALLRRGRVAHALIDGDNLDASYPAPDEIARGWFTTTSLTKIWATYRKAGQHRLIYVNTVSVLEASSLVAAVDPEAEVVGVLLTATVGSVHERLSVRERGSELAVHLERSAARRTQLERTAPTWVVRVDTTDRSVREVAAEVAALTGWMDTPLAGVNQATWA